MNVENFRFCESRQLVRALQTRWSRPVQCWVRCAPPCGQEAKRKLNVQVQLLGIKFFKMVGKYADSGQVN
jgi:hypothetical protein